MQTTFFVRATGWLSWVSKVFDFSSPVLVDSATGVGSYERKEGRESRKFHRLLPLYVGLV